MTGDTSLLGFIAASLLVLVIPGPGVLYIIACSISQGQRAGLVSVLGLSVGAFVHVAAATAGLSALLLTSVTAFSIVKLLGAGYLIYLGIRALLTPHSSAGVHVPAARPLHRLFTDGIVISALNPKIAVFFLAFLPQFVSQNSAPVELQVLSLGILYVFLALFTDGTYAILAGKLRGWTDSKVIQGPLPGYMSGLVYLGLGISTALTDRPRG